jgi:hypothetical protein
MRYLGSPIHSLTVSRDRLSDQQGLEYLPKYANTTLSHQSAKSQWINVFSPDPTVDQVDPQIPH